MRTLFAIFLLTLPGLEARAEVFCYTTSLRHCDPNNWVWYPRTVPTYQYGGYGLPYGRSVRLSPQGEWIDRSGHRVWAYRGSRRATVLSELNSDERNGELAYQTAYDSYRESQDNGANSVQNVKVGRWRKRIVTGDGIVLYKDRQGNVAVQSPDGKWHVTDSAGLYASSSEQLVVPRADRSMVAKAAKKEGDRAPASVKPEAEPKEEAKPAEETAKAEPGEGGDEDISGVSTMETPAPAPVAEAPKADAPKADAPREPASAAAPAAADPLAEMVKQAAEEAAKKTAEAPAPEATKKQ